DRLLLRRIEHQEGDVDDPSDDRVVMEEFASALDAGAIGGPAAGRWLLDLPVHRVDSSGDGLVVSEGWFAYDGRPPGTLGGRGLVTREERRGGPSGQAAGAVLPGDPRNPVTARTYDTYGNMTSETDALGRTRVIRHGSLDPTFTFPDGEIDPLGRLTTRRFDPRTGLLVRVDDPNGRATQIRYDGFGRRTAEWGPLDSESHPTVTQRHDDWVLPARVFRYAREQSGAGEASGTVGNLESIAFFDGLGRLIETKTETVDGQMVVGRALTFDAAGRVATEAEPFLVPAGPDYVAPSRVGYVRRLEYDAASRRTAVTNAAGESRREERSGWSSTLIDPLGHRRDLKRNAFGELVAVDEFEGTGTEARVASSASYRYDAAGHLTQATDASGSTALLSYDALGRRTTLDDPHTGSWRYEFDLKGNLVSEIDPLGQVTTMSYDPLDRLLEKRPADGATAEWHYDEGGAAAGALGLLTSIADKTGTQAFTYDALGRVVVATRTLEGSTYTTRTAYDALGRVTSLQLPGGPPALYQYDEGGNLEAALPFAPSLSYNERGQVTRTLLANGLRVLRSYDPATGRPTEMQATNSAGAALLRLAYTYSPDAEIVSVDDLTVPAAPAGQRFTYDGRHRLTRAVGPYGDLTYAYDDAGNLVLKEGTTLYYDDPAHRQCLTRTSDGRTFTYDAAGNVASILSPTSDRRLTYDGAGRLARLSDSGGGLLVQDDYDASGRRIREITERAGSRTVLLTPLPQIEVRDGAATLQYFAGDLRVATVEASGRILYPVADHLGSIRLLVDGEQSVVARYDFRPYGGTLTDQTGPGTPAAERLFAGVLQNEADGLLLMGTRHYDPALGRFLQPDALVADRLDPHALNRYAYARDNPVNLTDPEGRNPLAAILFMGALALLDRDTRQDVAGSVAVTAATIFITGALGPGAGSGVRALVASRAALYAAAVTPVILHSPLGQGIVESYTLVLQDLGLSPRSASLASGLFTTFLLNSSLQRGFAHSMAHNGSVESGEAIGGRSALDPYLASR
ncbi:MAG TPA: RHS repeat-associated core domain-containing protein, partial [Candidatus Polarisedimenticolia bacterium]|nr:RHS repeat-associated core domain-containing protein [Candidatus Polarisedimenticolia bacterium]